MRRFIIVWISLMALLSAAITSVQAADVSLSITCVDHSQPDRLIVHFGYAASETVEGTGYIGPVGNFGGDMPPNILEAGQHDDVFTIEVYYSPVIWQFVYGDGQVAQLSVDIDTTGPDCADLAEQWHPGAPSIYVVMESDCAFVEIQDAYGHWSQVTSNGEPVLLHYGEALIGGHNQSTDPDDYRAVATACF